MRSTPRTPLAAALALGMAATTVPAQAQEEGFYFTAGYQLQRDSNLFRLPPTLSPQLVLGRSSAADLLQITSLGVGFDRRYSLQTVHAEVSVVDYDYQHFSQYDLVATNYKLSWDWAYTPQLRGRVYADRSESINSFDDFTAQSSGTNRRLRSAYGASLNYELDGLWSLRSGAFNSEDRNDEDVVGADGYRQNSLEAGVRRQFGSGSSATALMRHSQGRNLNGQITSDSFRQTDLQLDLRWVFSGVTSANASVQHLDRSYPAVRGFDYSGIKASGSVNWQPTGQLLWTFTGGSDLNSYQSASSTHARTNRLGVSGLWMTSARTNLRASVNQSRLRLLGHPSGGSTSPRRDTTLETGLTFTWNLDDFLAVQTGLQHRKRNSTVSAYDYSSTLVNVGVNARF